MTRRIFRNVAITAALSVVLAVVLTTLLFFDTYVRDMSAELHSEANSICYALSREADETAFFDHFSSTRNRVTLIAPDGKVLYDSRADATQMDSHADRPEVVDTLKNGWGESERRSDTLSETTYYYAVRTDDGNILRVANTRSSMVGVFMQAVPLLLAILAAVVVISMVIARFAARRIVAPMNSLNLDAPLENEIYDELSPLLTRMDRQRREIDRQVRALSDARRELSAITQNMREGMILLDRDGKVLSMNGSASQIFDVEAEERIGNDMLAVSRNPSLQNVVEQARNGQSGDAIMERNNRSYQLLASPVLREGGVAGVVILIMDVTEKRAAEQSRREFTANVSHELKTPLTSISGYAEIIRDGVAKPEDVANFADRIHSEANHLLSLINDIMELSRLDERRGLGEMEEIDLMSAARESVRRLQPLAEEKGIEMQVFGDAVCIYGYPALLGEMLYNLVDNAVKYTGAGGKVEVQVERTRRGPIVTVRDTGIGIPPEHHKHVFERFYRVDKSHSRATGGTGLGLSIVKHGAAIHGAEIYLESAEGEGTRIALHFPEQKKSF